MKKIICALTGLFFSLTAYATIVEVTDFLPLAQIVQKTKSKHQQLANKKAHKAVAKKTVAPVKEQVKIAPEFEALLADAESGDLKAQYRVAVSYYLGAMADENHKETKIPVKQDYSKARYWLEHIINTQPEGSVPSAEYGIGLLYLEGDGVPQNYQAAAQWFKKSALHGKAYAQYELGIMYRDGAGVPKDYVTAYTLFNYASMSITDARIDREHLERKMRQSDVLRAQSLTIEDVLK